MRTVLNLQPALGQIPIEEIEFDPRSRDDIPAVLQGIQFLYCDLELRCKVLDLLESRLLAPQDAPADPAAEPGSQRPPIDPSTGRPGMELWNILVLGLLKQGLNCDYDRLAELAAKHLDVRRMLGCSDVFGRPTWSQRTLVRNVALLTPALLAEVNRLVVKAGHELAGHWAGQPLQARCDSVVVETDVHYPTDVSLLWDALRCLIRTAAALSEECGLGGWRQKAPLLLKARRLFNRVRSSKQRTRSPQRVQAYLQLARELAGRAGRTLGELAEAGAAEAVQGTVQELQHYLDCAERLADQVKRRVLEGERIAQEEKIYSVFEEHTRWCAKGKAGRAVELGVPVSVLESEHQCILHHAVMGEEEDVDLLPGLLEEAQASYPDLSGCSFDKGFYSPSNRRRLDERLQLNAMPRKGRLSKADRERETAPEFVAARREHAAVESAIHNLEQRGFERVLAHGPEGFARMVALSVLAVNVHRIGVLLQRRARERLKRGSLARAA